MKKSIVLILIVAFLLCACQPTPQHEVVVNKGDDLFEIKLESAKEKDSESTPVILFPEDTVSLIPNESDCETPSPQSSSESDLDKTTSQIQVLVEPHWTDEVALRNFSFTIDVDIEAPITGSFPVYSIAASEFYNNDQRVNAVLDVLIQNVIGVRSGGITKEEYENEMRNYLRGYYDDETKTYIEPTESERDQQMQEFLKAIENAPDANAFCPISNREEFSIPASTAYQTKSGEIWDVQIDAQQLTIKKLPRGVLQPERWVTAGTATPDEPKGTTLQNVAITQDEAEEIVASFFESTQLGDFAISSIEKARIIDAYSFETYSEGWSIECARVCGQCYPFAYRRYRNGNSLRFTDEAYAAELPLETLTLFVDESGIRQLTWSNPLHIIEKLTDNIELIPFEDMKPLIRQTLRSSLSWAGDKESGSSLGNGRVTRIILSSCYIPQKNSPGKFYLTPAWFILAGFDHSLENGVQPQAFAINAVDGTRIELNSRS